MTATSFPTSCKLSKKEERKIEACERFDGTMNVEINQAGRKLCFARKDLVHNQDAAGPGNRAMVFISAGSTLFFLSAKIENYRRFDSCCLAFFFFSMSSHHFVSLLLILRTKCILLVLVWRPVQGLLFTIMSCRKRKPLECGR